MKDLAFMNKEDDQPTPREQVQGGKFPEDALLRRNGWRIYSRRPNESPVWVKDGKAVLHRDALATLPKKERELLK